MINGIGQQKIEIPINRTTRFDMLWLIESRITDTEQKEYPMLPDQVRERILAAVCGDK